jgi:hypothetical protein
VEVFINIVSKKCFNTSSDLDLWWLNLGCLKMMKINHFSLGLVVNSYLTNYGQKANLWTFWTFSYGGKLRILGRNKGVRAVWTRILPRGMRTIERTWWNREASGTKSSGSDKSTGKTPTWIGCPPRITPIRRHQTSLWEPQDATEALRYGAGTQIRRTIWQWYEGTW